MAAAAYGNALPAYDPNTAAAAEDSEYYNDYYGNYYYDEEHQQSSLPTGPHQQLMSAYTYSYEPPPPQPQLPPLPPQHLHPLSYAPPPSSSTSAGASSSPKGTLHLLMARTVSQGESDLIGSSEGVADSGFADSRGSSEGVADSGFVDSRGSSEGVADSGFVDSRGSSEGVAGWGLAGQSHREDVGGRVVGPEGSEVWVSDNGATNHITSDARNVYDWIDVPPGKEYVLIGNGKGMKVKGVGSLNLKMHSKTDFNVKLTGVYVTEGIGFNLFSLHDAQARQTITLDKEGVHLFDHRLTFPRDSIGSSLHATRMAPTPTADLTAVPALSGFSSASASPPFSQSTLPDVQLASSPLTQPPLPTHDVVGEVPPDFDSHPLSHHSVEGVVLENYGFSPALTGVVPSSPRFPPTDGGVVTAEIGYTKYGGAEV